MLPTSVATEQPVIPGETRVIDVVIPLPVALPVAFPAATAFNAALMAAAFLEAHVFVVAVDVVVIVIVVVMEMAAEVAPRETAEKEEDVGRVVAPIFDGSAIFWKWWRRNNDENDVQSTI